MVPQSVLKINEIRDQAQPRDMEQLKKQARWISMHDLYVGLPYSTCVQTLYGHIIFHTCVHTMYGHF